MASLINRLSWAFFLVSSIAVGAVEDGGSRSCAEYYRDRVAFLLGCCGDLPQHYQGPMFGNLTDLERATKALAEIAASRKLVCYKRESTEFRTLALNEIGALIMRARALSSRSRSKDDLDAALLDAEAARREMQMFVATNPNDAIAVWTWTALSLRNCGRLLDALSFLGRLPVGCCQENEMAVMKGDIYFDLGIYDAAAQWYSQWLADGSPTPVCGRDTSLGRAAELRKRGFRVPSPAPNAIVSCAPQSTSEWEPYVALGGR